MISGVDAIARMTDDGFQPVLVLETSPGNFQTWLNHGRILSDHTFSTQAAKELARRFGGDPAPTGATSVGLRASRIKSQRGGCRTDWRRSFGCIGARVGPTTPRTNSLKRRNHSQRKRSPNIRRGRHLGQLRIRTHFGHSLSFIVIRTTTAICIAPTCLGPYTQRVVVSRNSRSETRFFMPATCQRRAALSAKSIMQSEQRSRPLPAPNRCVEHAVRGTRHREDQSVMISVTRHHIRVPPCARFAQFRRAGPGGPLRSVTAELHGYTRAHWARSFAPHRVFFLPRLSVWSGADEGGEKGS